MWQQEIDGKLCTGEDITYIKFQEISSRPNEAAYMTDPQYADCVGEEIK